MARLVATQMAVIEPQGTKVMVRGISTEVINQFGPAPAPLSLQLFLLVNQGLQPRIYP